LNPLIKSWYKTLGLAILIIATIKVLLIIVGLLVAVLFGFPMDWETINDILIIALILVIINKLLIDLIL